MATIDGGALSVLSLDGGASCHFRIGSLIPIDAQPDGSAPVVGNFVPTPGTPIATTAHLQFDVTDNLSSLRAVFVVCFFASGAVEVVYDGSAFRAGYESSTRTGIAGGYRFTVFRTGGWTSAPSLQMFAFDTSGNEGN